MNSGGNLTCIFDKKKYTLLGENIIQQHHISSVPVRNYICKGCLPQIQQNISCVSCHLTLSQCMSKLYNMDDYDFLQYIVSQCLPNINGEDDKFICLSCHKNLQETNNENALVPYHVKNKCVTAADNFLKSLQ